MMRSVGVKNTMTHTAKARTRTCEKIQLWREICVDGATFCPPDDDPLNELKLEEDEVPEPEKETVLLW